MIRGGLALCLAVALSTPARAHVPVIEYVTPDDDWCALIGTSLYSDTFQFLPGDYEGPCTVVGLPPDAPNERLVLEALYPHTVTFRPGATGDHVLAVEGISVTVRNVVFAEVPAGSSAITVQGEDVVIEAVQVQDSAGVAVRQVGDLDRFEAFDNQWTQTGGIGLQLGCLGCASTDMRVHDNLFLGADIGIQGTSGPWGYLRDNFVQASEVGVLWTGHQVEPSIVEENLLVAPDSLRAVGGSQLVRSNLLVGEVLLSGPGDVGLFGNTVYAGGAPLRLEDWGDPTGLDVRNNALSGPAPELPGATLAANLDCTEACTCWMDAEAWDFYPSPRSPLRDQGVEQAFGELQADWCGNPRPSVPSVGAFQAVSVLGPGAVEMVGRSETSCSYPPDPEPGEEPMPCGELPPVDTGTGTPTPTGEPSEPGPKRSAEPSGCGCAISTPSGGGLGAALGLLVALVRRRI